MTSLRKIVTIVAILWVFVLPTLSQASPTNQAAKTARTTLAWQARYTAQHGGIIASCKWCATAKMQRLMIKVYTARFESAGPIAQRTAVCLMTAESGRNPGAISDTGDFGGPQINKQAHGSDHPEWFKPGRGFKYLIFDPWYGASRMWAMSSRGTKWGAWTGTYGEGLCHF